MGSEKEKAKTLGGLSKAKGKRMPGAGKGERCMQSSVNVCHGEDKSVECQFLLFAVISLPARLEQT